MPDFNIESYWLCKSAQGWETTVNGHVVAYRYQHGGPVQYDWECDCKGFKFRRRCRHIEEAKPKHCGWMQFEDGDEPVTVTDGDARERRCPRCHGDITAERYAV